jgi:hypothetical protein
MDAADRPRGATHNRACSPPKQEGGEMALRSSGSNSTSSASFDAQERCVGGGAALGTRSRLNALRAHFPYYDYLLENEKRSRHTQQNQGITLPVGCKMNLDLLGIEAEFGGKQPC